MKPKSTSKKAPVKKTTRPATRKAAVKRPQASSRVGSSSFLSSPTRFSRPQLTMLALACVIFGIFIIFLTRASSIPLTVVEAESLTPSVGTIVVTDSAASGTKALHFTINGTATGSFTLPSESSNLTLRAKGVACDGSPQAIVKVDGVVVQTATVNSTGWADYTVAAKLTAGTHAITITYSNDYNKHKKGNNRLICTRDLFVDKVEFLGAGDASAPTAAVLSASAGNQQVVLTWTAATDDIGVVRYEVWREDVNTYITTVPASELMYTITGLINGAEYKYRVVAYDATGKYTNSNVVMVAPTSSTPVVSSCSSPSPFPSRLKASGRQITDENGCTMPKLKGFNMHVGPGFTWSQANFDEIKALAGNKTGNTVNRAVLHWDQFEPSRGVVADLTNLDQHISRAQAAGMYTILELHLNVNRSPAWANDSDIQGDEMKMYERYGVTITKALAARYGNNKAVIGFSLNEPPISDHTIRNGNGSIPWLEDKQRKMIGWFRTGGAPAWMGFVAVGYAGATPIYDDSWQNSSAIDASPTAYDAVGGNVVYDLHDYMAGCAGTKSTDPNCDGRQYNGMNYPTYQGGPQIGTDSTTYTYSSTSVRRGQLSGFVKPYKNFTTQANIPLMLGEWGWSSRALGGIASENAWITDQKAIWADAGTSIEIYWNYDTSSTKTEWSAKINSTTWRPSVLEWMKN